MATKPIKSMATRKKPIDSKYTTDEVVAQINFGSNYAGIEGVRHTLLAIAMMEYNKTIEDNRNENSQ